MERETKTIETKNGHKVELKTYITGGESREISNVYIGDSTIEMDEVGKVKMPNISTGLISKAQDKTIELVVVSVDGVKENIVKAVLDLKKEDFDQVIEAINEIQNGLDKKKD